MEQVSLFNRENVLEQITFYSLCSTEDRKKILGELPMTFNDFRRFSLISDYLQLHAFNEMLWDLYSDTYLSDIFDLMEKCTANHEDIPYLLSEARQWLADFRAQAPNETVAFLLKKVFSRKLEPKTLF